LAVALAEIGGGLALAVSSVLREPVRASPVEHAETKVCTAVQLTTPAAFETPEQTLTSEGMTDVSNPVLAKMVIPDTFAGRLMAQLNDRGGEVYSGHRALGRALGCSAGHIGNVLRELAAAGHVTVQATKMGTVVRLAA
jgi:hypothetical protein